MNTTLQSQAPRTVGRRTSLDDRILHSDERQAWETLQSEKYWRNGTTLRVHFMGTGDEIEVLRECSKSYMQDWESYANIKFKLDCPFGSSDIRIKLSGGHYSEYVLGTDCLQDSRLQTWTMMFSLQQPWNMNDPVVLHELGHCIALEHEHQRISRPFELIESAAYTHYLQQGDTHQEVRTNMLNVLASQIDRPPWDPKSIMQYSIPEDIPPHIMKVKEGFEEIPAFIQYAKTLSNKDKATVTYANPKPTGGNLEHCVSAGGPFESYQVVKFPAPQFSAPRMLIDIQGVSLQFGSPKASLSAEVVSSGRAGFDCLCMWMCRRPPVVQDLVTGLQGHDSGPGLQAGRGGYEVFNGRWPSQHEDAEKSNLTKPYGQQIIWTSGLAFDNIQIEGGGVSIDREKVQYERRKFLLCLIF